MKPEHKLLIGRHCYVDVDGQRKRGEIVDIAESIVRPNKIILYCVKLIPRPKPIQMHYDIGTDSVELIERKGKL